MMRVTISIFARFRKSEPFFLLLQRNLFCYLKVKRSLAFRFLSLRRLSLFSDPSFFSLAGRLQGFNSEGQVFGKTPKLVKLFQRKCVIWRNRAYLGIVVNSQPRNQGASPPPPPFSHHCIWFEFETKMAGTVRTFAHIRTAPSMLISKANPLTRKITSQQTELTMENFVTQNRNSPTDSTYHSFGIIFIWWLRRQLWKTNHVAIRIKIE